MTAKKRHVDYVRDYPNNLIPVIPHDATLSPSSTIDPGNRGKVPGQRKADGTWYGGWKDLPAATMATAKKWDAWGAYIGKRTGFDGVFSIDIDLTVREDVELVVEIARQLFGKTLAIRGVAHPEHTKLLICLRLEDPMPASFNLDVIQSDGKHGQIQFLGPGRYFNVHGVHPKRLRPYVWENDPADVPLVSVNLAEFEAFWTAIGQDFEVTHRPRLHAFNQVQREPERCTPEAMQALVELIPNDHTFEAYADFIAMGAAMYGASGGADWGRIQWLAWCDQVDQPQDRKPEIFWDSMSHARSGAGELRMFANQRQPLEMARRDFADPPIEDVEPELVEQADIDAEVKRAFLERDWCMVAGAGFYSVAYPDQAMSSAAFGLVNAKREKALRRAIGGDKKLSLAKLFARHSKNVLDRVAHEPGRPRFIEEEGQRALNFWSPPPRPHLGLPIDLKVIDFYRDLVEFVLGSAEETELWMKWHAWLLQNLDKAPGWHWIVQTGQGRGKDFILRPIGQAHGDGYTPINPRDLSAPYNDYAEKHLISASEMKERGRDDGYVMLKAITSGAKRIAIRIPYRKRYLAPNVAAFVVFSNDEHPLKIDSDDRRLHVVSNFSEEKRPPEYYAKALRLLDQHWAMIGEHLLTMPLSDADVDLLTGNAPRSDAKVEMAEQVAESTICDIIGEIESDKPPPHYLPIATTGEVFDWLKREHLRPHELPNRLEMLTLLYRLGARPLNPNRKRPNRAEPIQGARLWRIAKTWNGWNLETATPARLAKLYFDRAMPPADLKAVDEGEA